MPKVEPTPTSPLEPPRNGTIPKSVEKSQKDASRVKTLPVGPSPSLPLDTLTQQVKLNITKDTRITKEDFTALLPPHFDRTKPSPNQWHHFDTSHLDELLARLRSGEVSEIETLTGEVYRKIPFDSPFEKKLYVKGQDLDKAQVVAKQYKTFIGTNRDWTEKEKETLENVLSKYVDFIGVNNRNILKILSQDTNTKALMQSEKGQTVRDFLKEVSNAMATQVEKIRREEATVPPSRRPGSDTIMITTTASGGAHLSISNVIRSNLEKQGLKTTVLDESKLEQTDGLCRCIGLPRSEVYNKISQQSDRMAYGRKLKELDDEIALFIKDNRVNKLRGALGESKLLVSTSHHPSNVRVLADGAENVCFQICDYGEMPDKLAPLVKTVSKYNLDGVVFFAPSERTKMQLTKKTDSLPPATPKRSQSGVIPDHLIQRYRNFSHFVRVNRYPVQESFTSALNQDEVTRIKKELNIRTDANCWVLTMGSQGVGGILEKYIEQIVSGYINHLTDETPLDVAILCGKNEQMHTSLLQFANEKIREKCNNDPALIAEVNQKLRFIPLGMQPQNYVAILGRSSNIFLSKPGGGTTAEALAGGFPMIIHKEENHPWEFGNIEELQLQGAAVIQEGDDFYQLAKQKGSINPYCNPEQCVDYTLKALYGILEAKEHLRQISSGNLNG